MIAANGVVARLFSRSILAFAAGICGKPRSLGRHRGDGGAQGEKLPYKPDSKRSTMFLLKRNGCHPDPYHFATSRLRHQADWAG